MEKKFLSVRELAEYLDYTEQSIRNLVTQNKIPYLKPNGKLFFEKAAIDNWMRGDHGKSAT